MIPTQLSGLQVGFEIDDGLYEVHSLTKGVVVSRDCSTYPTLDLESHYT